MPWREPQGLLTPQIQRLKLTGGKQSCSCGSFEAWVPSLRAVLCVCTMEAWIKQMQELRLKNVAVQHRKLCLHLPHGAPSRPDRAVRAEHSPLRAFSWASLALGLVAPQGKARDILWQFSCRLGLLRGPCTPASPAAPSPSLPPWTWSPQGKHGAQSYCSCVWHPWKGKKTPKKNGRNRKRDTKYGVAKLPLHSFHKGSMNPSFKEVLCQGKHNMATPNERSTATSRADGAGQQCPGGTGPGWEDPSPQGKKPPRNRLYF